MNIIHAEMRHDAGLPKRLTLVDIINFTTVAVARATNTQWHQETGEHPTLTKSSEHIHVEACDLGAGTLDTFHPICAVPTRERLGSCHTYLCDPPACIHI